jgi:opacity protein-like surface antigen
MALSDYTAFDQSNHTMACQRLICFFSFILFACFGVNAGIILPAHAGGQASPDSLHSTVIQPDYSNTIYAQIAIPIQGLTISGVNDLRSSGAGAPAPRAIGFADGDTQLELSEPVSVFARRSFETMLSGSDESGTQREIVLNIEELWLDHQKTSLLNNHLEFSARIAVAIVHEGDTVKAGYLQTRQEADVPGNVREHQTDLLYRGMADMARQLARKMMPEKIVLEEDMEPEIQPIEQPDLVEIPGVAQSGAEPFSGASLAVQVFTGDLMNDSYTALVGGRYYGGHWFRNHMGYRVFLDLSGATGTPQRVDADWEVNSSEITMSILSLGSTYLYSLRGDPTKSLFIPFVGAGIEGIFGAEKLSARATWNTVETIETDVWSIRTTFAVHALLATRIRVTDQWRFVLEARWTQSGKGSNLDLKDEAERKILHETLYSAVRRSDFNFTGWSIHAGLEW